MPVGFQPELTQDYLKRIMSYDPSTGIFRWKVHRPAMQPGDRAGHRTVDKGCVHWSIKIDHRKYKAHRLAWFYVYGCWPPLYLTHINGDGADNRWDNIEIKPPKIRKPTYVPEHWVIRIGKVEARFATANQAEDALAAYYQRIEQVVGT